MRKIQIYMCTYSSPISVIEKWGSSGCQVCHESQVHIVCVVCPRVSVEDDGWRSGDAGHTPRMYGEAASCPHTGTHCLSLSVPSSHDSADI